MSAVLQEKYTILGRAPYLLGRFTLASYKARESGSAANGAPSGRVVLLRQFAVVPGAADDLAAASSVAAALPADMRILRHYGLITIGADPTGEPSLDTGVYAVSEWVQGMTLAERIQRVAPFSLTVALNMTIDVAHAALRAEAVGVEHGNLTADEIFVTTDGQTKVADFALGRAATQPSVASSAPPSAASQDSLRALAALLYEMLTGQPAGASGPLSPRAREQSVPSAIDGITQKAALGRAPGGYRGMAAMLADLQTAREQLRQGRSLEWTPQPVDAVAELPVAEAPMRTSAQFAPPPVAAAAPSDEFKPLPVGEPELISNMPRITPSDPGRQTIPAASIDRPSDAGEDAEVDYYEPRRSPAMAVLRGLGIVVLSLIIIAVVFACAYFALLVSNVPSDITVPNLIGKQYDDAKQTAAQGHFKLMQIGHNNSDTYPQGAIYQQTPANGRMIKSGKTVDVFVSDGPRLLDVPDLSQTALTKAQAVLQDAGLPLGSVESQYDPIVPKGIVISQQPVAAAKVSRDQAINLVVSKGPPPPAAPANLSATCTLNGEIDLSWDPVPIATTYDVYRDGKKIQTGFPETEYSDVGLDADQTHVYTVTAVNANGESPASQPASAVAQPGQQQTDVPGAVPDSGNDSDDGQDQTGDAAVPPPASTATAGTPKQRQFEVKFRVPRGSSSTHNVQIQVQDATGTNVAFDQDLSRGDTVDQQVQGFGNRIIIRIFIDSKLVKQQTK